MGSIYESDGFVDDFDFTQSLLSDTIRKLKEDIQTSGPLPPRIEKQLEDLFNGRSSSISIKATGSDASTRKIRFINKGFQKKIGKLNKKFEEVHFKTPSAKSSVKKYEELLNLLSNQIEKGEIIFKVTSSKGKSTYGASARIMEQMRHGGVVTVGKSKKERVYVIGAQAQATTSPNRTVKAISVSIIDSKEFAKAAHMLKEAVSQLHTESESKTSLEEKYTELLSEAPGSERILQKHEATTEKTKRSHAVAQKKGTHSTDVEQDEDDVDSVRTFARQEKQKDLKAKDKLAKIEADEVKRTGIKRKH